MGIFFKIRISNVKWDLISFLTRKLINLPYRIEFTYEIFGVHNKLNGIFFFQKTFIFFINCFALIENIRINIKFYKREQ